MYNTGNFISLQDLDRNCIYVTFGKNLCMKICQIVIEMYSVTIMVSLRYTVPKYGLQNGFIDNDCVNTVFTYNYCGIIIFIDNDCVDTVFTDNYCDIIVLHRLEL